MIKKNYFKNKVWYHATPLRSAEKMEAGGYAINAAINKGNSLDFGNGFYLSESEDFAKKFAKVIADKVEAATGGRPQMAILVFEYDAELAEKEGLTTKFFDEQGEEFIDFVVGCRVFPKDENSGAVEDMVAGPMTIWENDVIAEKYHRGLATMEEVRAEYAQPTGDMQLLLHTQKACDRVKFIRRYTL